jgi:hypothetical protein
MAQQPQIAAVSGPEHKAVRREGHFLSVFKGRAVMNDERLHGNNPTAMQRVGQSFDDDGWPALRRRRSPLASAPRSAALTETFKAIMKSPPPNRVGFITKS